MSGRHVNCGFWHWWAVYVLALAGNGGVVPCSYTAHTPHTSIIMGDVCAMLCYVVCPVWARYGPCKGEVWVRYGQGTTPKWKLICFHVLRNNKTVQNFLVKYEVGDWWEHTLPIMTVKFQYDVLNIRGMWSEVTWTTIPHFQGPCNKYFDRRPRCCFLDLCYSLFSYGVHYCRLAFEHF